MDSAKAVVKLWGLQIQVRNTTFQTLIPDLQANRCDIVWTALFVNAKRLAVAEAVPYLTTGHEVLVPTGNPENIKTLDDLYQLLKHDQTNRMMIWLEVTIVLLFVIDLVVLVLGLKGR